MEVSEHVHDLPSFFIIFKREAGKYCTLYNITVRLPDKSNSKVNSIRISRAW